VRVSEPEPVVAPGLVEATPEIEIDAEPVVAKY
jgi:hypothetical protein